MKIIATIFLGLIALFTGGCSIVFAPMLLQGSPDIQLVLLWSSGVVVAALAIYAIVILHRKPPGTS